MLFKRVFDLANKYRVGVYCLFCSFLLVNWGSLPISPQGSDPRLLLAVVFLIGLVWIYLFNKTCDRVEDAISQPEEMFLDKENRIFSRLLPFVAAFPILLLLSAHVPVWPYLFYIGLGFLYSYPLINGFRLKNVPLLKNFIAGINMLSPLWFGLYVYFPPLYVSPYYPAVSFLTAVFFIYVSGEILWDIRDVEGDKATNIQTIPVVFGILYAKIIALLFVCVGLYLLPHILANYIICITVATSIVLAKPNRSKYYYHLFLYFLSGVLVMAVLWK